MARVLIIDDDTDLVQLLKMALEPTGHVVESAGDPAEGLQQARAFHPEIILLDYHMPGNPGAHLFETFRRNQATATTPILFMSGEASPEQVLAEITDTANSRFIPKPVQLSELRRVIDDMLAGKV